MKRWHAVLPQVSFFFPCLSQSSAVARSWCSAPNDKVDGETLKPSGSTVSASALLYKQVLIRSTVAATNGNISIRQITTDRS
jgi:hypothetical protein